MPVRKIPKSYTNVTGYVVSNNKSDDSIAYEGNLEFYCFKLVLFNLNVLKCEEQPVRIQFTHTDGKELSYTPDMLITYRRDIFPVKTWKPLLAEVKPRRWLAKNWHELHPKFLAARRFVKEKDWEFAILSEREIINPYVNSTCKCNFELGQ